jgi:hypothetical protein
LSDILAKEADYMKKIFLLCLLLIFTSLTYFSLPLSTRVTLPTQSARGKLLLLPLDSRPACGSMVAKLGSLAGIRVVLPPRDLLDNYRQPANSEGLWQWLSEQAPSYDESIIAGDLLLHGGLLQTRQHIASEAEQELFLAKLRDLQTQAASKNDAPRRLSLFTVIPRLLVSDELLPDRWYKFHLMRYSQLADMVEINNDYTMTEALKEYQEEIPKPILEKYKTLYQANQDFNNRLLDLLQESSAKASNSEAELSLVIGQDDSSPFGLPQRVAKRLERRLEAESLAPHAQLGCGADELAALLLTRHFLRQSKCQPRVYVRYGTPATATKYMPYMALSVEAALRNQCELVGACLCDTPEEADVLLYVHCGDDDEPVRDEEVRAMRKLLAAEKPLALVDLSANFEASEMLLPKLLQAGFPLNRLAAYAGWNTFGNSSGTALAQGLLFSGALRRLVSEKQSEEAIATLYAENLRFTCERMLEDFAYQKLLHAELRANLEALGSEPTALTVAEKQATERYLQARLSLLADLLLHGNLKRTPFYQGAGKDYYLKELTLGVQLPWNRVFEVELTLSTATGSITR